MRKLEQFGTRILVSVMLGYLVAVVASIVAWLNVGMMPNFYPNQRATWQALSDIDHMIAVYRRDKKSPPQSLTELRSINEVYHQFGFDEDSNPLDAWGRPFVYSVDGNHYTVSSFGRDGRLGGVGLDYDLSNNNSWPEDARPTFRQFISQKPAWGVIATCLACGVVVFFIGVTTVDPSAIQSRASVVALVVKLVVTILGTVMTSVFISALHIPNHH